MRPDLLCGVGVEFVPREKTVRKLMYAMIFFWPHLLSNRQLTPQRSGLLKIINIIKIRELFYYYFIIQGPFLNSCHDLFFKDLILFFFIFLIFILFIFLMIFFIFAECLSYFFFLLRNAVKKFFDFFKMALTIPKV